MSLKPLPDPVRILAIDGGGIGGIIPATVIEHLLTADADFLRKADVFAGTSTGALLSLRVALNKPLGPNELSGLYLNNVASIFPPRLQNETAFSGLLLSKHRPGGLGATVAGIAGPTTTLDELGKPVVIPVTALDRPGTSHVPAGVFLSTAYKLLGLPTKAARTLLTEKEKALGLEKPRETYEKYASGSWTCRDAALATAAAPTYFPAHVVPDPGTPPGTAGRKAYVCWDGGIVANNPTLVAVGEVYRLADLAGQRRPDVRVLSLGTGYEMFRITGRDYPAWARTPFGVGAMDWGKLWAARNIVGVLLDASVGSTAFLAQQVLGDHVFRLTPDLTDPAPGISYEMDDPGMVAPLAAFTKNFCTRLTAVGQPDKTKRSVLDWLAKHW